VQWRYVPESDRCEMVHSISRPAKSSVTGDDVGSDGLEYDSNVEKNNVEYSNVP
jgi:hypothetical protein